MLRKNKDFIITVENTVGFERKDDEPKEIAIGNDRLRIEEVIDHQRLRVSLRRDTKKG